MNDFRGAIELRTLNFRILLTETLTPSLRKRLNHALNLHSEALVASNPDGYITDLDQTHEQLLQHWDKTHGDMIVRAHLLRDIASFQQFLTSNLLAEYTGHQQETSPWLEAQAKAISEGLSAGEEQGEPDSYYQRHVVFPLEEMMLDRELVCEKIRVATGMSITSQSKIQRLIGQKQWKTLATTLNSDNQLAQTLFHQHPLNQRFIRSDERDRVLRAIEGIEKKYSKELATDFDCSEEVSSYSGSTRNFFERLSSWVPRAAPPTSGGGESSPLLRRRKAQ